MSKCANKSEPTFATFRIAYRYKSNHNGRVRLELCLGDKCNLSDVAEAMAIALRNAHLHGLRILHVSLDTTAINMLLRARQVRSQKALNGRA